MGSKDYFSNDIDGKYNVVTASRQPGVINKAFKLCGRIGNRKSNGGVNIYRSTNLFLMLKTKSHIAPTNYGNHYFGVQTLRSSLASSLNIPAVKMINLNGVGNFIASASAMGISKFKDPSQYGLSLTLGGGEVMMTDMAVAFGTLASTGIKQPLNSILEVTDRHGKKLDEYEYVPGERVISRETSFIIQQILSDDGARSMVFGSGSMLNIKGHPEVAVKNRNNK